MSGGVRVEGAALEVVADGLDTRSATLEATTAPSAPDAGRSTDELAAALAAVGEGLAELATGVGQVSGSIRSALSAYSAWDASMAESASGLAE